MVQIAMSEYVLVESRDAITQKEVMTGTVNMAADLRKQGYRVTLFLSNAGLPEDQSSSFSKQLQEVSHAGVLILADEQTLMARGLSKKQMPLHIKTASLNIVAAHLADGNIVIWH